MTEIAERLATIRARIDAAIARRGPGPEVRLIGVGKRQPLDKLLDAHAAGLRDFGENYAQELRDKQHDWPTELEVRWHYIGALQANKLKYLVGKTALIHTVDRPELITAIDERAARLGVTQPFLLEVAIAGEQQKAGVAPERIPELLDACARTEHGAARCVGLMIIPPADDDPEQTRPWFRALRQLHERLREGPERANVELRELSMGMSADFELAIEEGATLVRVGTSIFGERS
jgi:pyridoxal phosphate enzyme (YggS family)